MRLEMPELAVRMLHTGLHPERYAVPTLHIKY